MEIDRTGCNIPDGLNATYSTRAPNEPVVLYKGPVRVESNWLTAENGGEVVLHWLPKPKLLLHVSRPDLRGGLAIRADKETSIRAGVLWEGEWCFGDTTLEKLDLAEGIAVFEVGRA